MSYEAWRREVALGRMPDWDEEKGDYASGGRACGDCWWRMVNDPPRKPHQRCANGHPLSWFDPDTMDPERGYRDCDDDGTHDEEE